MIQTQELVIKMLPIQLITYPIYLCQEWSILLKTSFNVHRFKVLGWKIKEEQVQHKAILKELYLVKK